MAKINVTKAFLPPLAEYVSYLENIWQSGQVTNNGPFVQELTTRLRRYLDAPNMLYVCNGTAALMLAIDALKLENCEIITTPFTYVATSSAILWQKCAPVFADILPDTLCVDPKSVERLITPKTRAILAVHVYGIPCAVDELEKIATNNGLKTIYDAAHAFAVKYREKSILKYGDISTLSFHATKLFHTIEGGAIATNNKELWNICEQEARFGHNEDDHVRCGINAKNSEFHAAMGLLNLGYVDEVITSRKHASEYYDERLKKYLRRPVIPERTIYNYAYYPVIFEEESALLKVNEQLRKANIYPRRYFYPSLNQLPYMPNAICPVSDSISKRVLCLPLYADMREETLETVTRIVLNVIR